MKTNHARGFKEKRTGKVKAVVKIPKHGKVIRMLKGTNVGALLPDGSAVRPKGDGAESKREVMYSNRGKKSFVRTRVRRKMDAFIRKELNRETETSD